MHILILYDDVAYREKLSESTLQELQAKLDHKKNQFHQERDQACRQLNNIITSLGCCLIYGIYVGLRYYFVTNPQRKAIKDVMAQMRADAPTGTPLPEQSAVVEAAPVDDRFQQLVSMAGDTLRSVVSAIPATSRLGSDDDPDAEGGDSGQARDNENDTGAEGVPPMIPLIPRGIQQPPYFPSFLPPGLEPAACPLTPSVLTPLTSEESQVLEAFPFSPDAVVEPPPRYQSIYILFDDDPPAFESADETSTLHAVELGPRGLATPDDDSLSLVEDDPTFYPSHEAPVDDDDPEQSDWSDSASTLALPSEDISSPAWIDPGSPFPVAPTVTCNYDAKPSISRGVLTSSSGVVDLDTQPVPFPSNSPVSTPAVAPIRAFPCTYSSSNASSVRLRCDEPPTHQRTASLSLLINETAPAAKRLFLRIAKVSRSFASDIPQSPVLVQSRILIKEKGGHLTGTLIMKGLPTLVVMARILFMAKLHRFPTARALHLLLTAYAQARN